jgi:hypothetical protein
LKSYLFSIVNILLFFSAKGQQIAFSGKVVESDSNTVMPYVYIINKSSGNGAMSDEFGKFSIIANDNDTLICSYVGHSKLQLPVSKLKKGDNHLLVVMKTLPVSLQAVTVTVFKLKPYEREYMNSIIEDTKRRLKPLNIVQSPITALYMQFSREGKELRKLSRIFEDLLIEEEVQKKFNPEILRKLTGDEKINYDQFRRYCFEVNNDYILTHDGVDLYSKIMGCYKRWKEEGR